MLTHSTSLKVNPEILEGLNAEFKTYNQ